MKKSVKIWVVLTALGLVLAFAFGCRNDVYVEPPPSLIGTYHGMFRYIEDNGATLQVNDSQYVTAIINTSYFQMYLNDSLTAPTARVACDCKAFYNIEGSVNISYSDNPSDGTSKNLTAQTCSIDRAPEGSFNLQQPADSVKLINQTTVARGGTNISVRKFILLKRDR